MIVKFLTGILVGIVVAVPIGPVGFLCVRKTLEFSFWGTVAVGLGAALADTIYSAVAVFGLAVFSSFLLEHMVYFKLCGGTLLLALAIKEYRCKNTSLETTPITRKGWASIFLTAFLMTISNPIGVIGFAGILAILGDTLLAIQDAIMLVFGVWVGSLAWWFILGKIVNHTKHLMPEKFICSIRRISAAILLIFSGWAFLSLLVD